MSAPARSARRPLRSRADWRDRPLAADGPFGHREVDHPGRPHQKRPAELIRRAKDNFADREGHYLRARAEPAATSCCTEWW
jgi:hypothetical protein